MHCCNFSIFFLLLRDFSGSYLEPGHLEQKEEENEEEQMVVLVNLRERPCESNRQESEEYTRRDQ